MQQAVVADLCAAFRLGDDDVRSCPMGSHGPDVQLSAAAKEHIPWTIECKNQERVNIWAAFAQAEANCGDRSVPVVVVKRNHEQPLCAMRWTHALALLQEAGEARRRRDDDSSADAAEDDVPRLLRRIADQLEKKVDP